jgi:hypothetical protein
MLQHAARAGLWRARFLFLCVLAPLAAHAAPSVTSYELISSLRAGRTTFDYTYRVRMLNDGGELRNVRGQVTSTSAATQIIDAQVTFGDVAAGAAAQSQDTFVLRQDRSVAFNPNALQWAITGDPPPPPPEEAFILEPVRIVRLDVAQPGGRPEHEILEPLQGSLVTSASTALANVVLSGAIDSLTIDVVNTSGAVLGIVPVAVPMPSAEGVDMSASFSRPTTSFRLRASGERTNGGHFELFSRVYSISDVQVRLLPPLTFVAAGTSVDLPVQVINHGAPATFRMTGTLTPPSTVTFSQDTVVLGTGQSAELTAFVQALAPTTQVPEITVTIRAQTTTSPVRSNTDATAINLEGVR